MYIDDFIWLPDIVEKLAAKHHVTMDETEDVFFNHPRFRFVESGYTSGEDVYSAMGPTDAGRYLIVFFIDKPKQAKARGSHSECLRYGFEGTEAL
jgi:uncharacterized protein